MSIANKYAKTIGEATIWRILRKSKRRAVPTWEDYRKLGLPPVEIMFTEDLLGLPMADPAQVLVVIPTRNRPAMCARALASLNAQTLKDWEAIVVWNGSKHGPQYALHLHDYLLDSRVHMVQIQQEGLAVALNAGFSFLGHHPFVWVLEDDDEAEAHFLEHMLASATNTGVDVVWCKQEQVPQKMQFRGDEDFSHGNMKKRNQINWPMCILRVGALKGVLPIDENVGPATDWDTHLRLLGAGAKYGFLNETLITHHWHETNYCLLESGKELILERVKQGYYD